MNDNKLVILLAVQTAVERLDRINGRNVAPEVVISVGQFPDSFFEERTFQQAKDMIMYDFVMYQYGLGDKPVWYNKLELMR